MNKNKIVFSVQYSILFVIILIICHLSPITSVRAFQYAALPVDNLLQNPWFRTGLAPDDCEWSGASWVSTSPAGWTLSDKTQDPTDVNCIEFGNIWWGYAARFAREGSEVFYPNTDAVTYQVVGPVSAANTTLHFHSLFVGHRVNQFKAEIYGGNSANGPWTSVWVPFNILNCLADDCINESPPNGVCNQGNRQCLWDEVTLHFLGTLSPLQQIIPLGYPYYKVEFLMNYPDPIPTATGDVGGKIARIYFKVSAGPPTPTPTPTSVPPSPTPTSPPGPTSTPGPTSNPANPAYQKTIQVVFDRQPIGITIISWKEI